MRANWFRSVALATAAVLALALSPAAPAGAQGEVDRFAFKGEVATAEWFLEDERNTLVFVSGLDGQSHHPPGAPRDQQSVSVLVFQSFCDEAADEIVSRSFFGFTDAPVDVARRLENASVDVPLSLSGHEFRIPGCDEPDFGGAQPVDLGSVNGALAADWDGIGERERMRRLFHLDTAGFKLRSHGSSTMRAAIANGSLEGLQEFGVPSALDGSTFADLRSVDDAQVVIGETPFHLPGGPMPPLPGPGPLGSETQRFSFRGDIADAFWALDDERNTGVSVSGLNGDRHTDSGPPEQLEEATVGVFQDFCDEATDELVFRSLFGSDAATVEVDEQLESANVTGEVSLSGTEFRMPGCETPDFEQGTLTAIDPVTAGVDVAWDGVGPEVRHREIFHYDSGDFKLRSRDRSTSREAVADGSVTGLEDFAVPAALGPSEFASLMSVDRAQVIIGEYPLLPPPG